jgi:cyclopropane fatty-acyl-phospholipid synthase-like methyltransferase
VSRAAFEVRYRAAADPWRTLSDPAELAKARHTLAVCGDGAFAAALELGCGIGGLTAALAPRCASLLALDGAPTAVAAARARLAAWPQAEVRTATIPDELPGGPFDLVVASEVLYYLAPAALAALVGWLPAALAPGGRVVAVHWTGSAPDLETTAAGAHAALSAAPGLALERAERGPSYLLAAFTRTA